MRGWINAASYFKLRQLPGQSRDDPMTDSSPPQPRKRPKQGRSTHLVEAIQQACQQILENEGAEHLTTQRIADVAGVTIGSLYQYFPNKEAVVADVFNNKMAKDAEATGVVFGCLAPQNELDFESNIDLIEAAKSLGLAVTFHRAFDFVENPKEALISLINFGVDRILTSGQHDKAINGIENIKALVKQANGAIEIMAGSCVNKTNAAQLAATGIDALHFTIHQTNNEQENLGMGSKTVVDEEKIKGVLNLLING